MFRFEQCATVQIIEVLVPLCSSQCFLNLGQIFDLVRQLLRRAHLESGVHRNCLPRVDADETIQALNLALRVPMQVAIRQKEFLHKGGRYKVIPC